MLTSCSLFQTWNLSGHNKMLWNLFSLLLLSFMFQQKSVSIRPCICYCKHGFTKKGSVLLAVYYDTCKIVVKISQNLLRNFVCWTKWIIHQSVEVETIDHRFQFSKSLKEDFMSVSCQLKSLFLKIIFREIRKFGLMNPMPFQFLLICHCRRSVNSFS